MTPYTEEYRHPTQASALLSIFDTPQGGYLVTESRPGTSTVIASLGVYANRGDALARVTDRGRELAAQRFERVAP